MDIMHKKLTTIFNELCHIEYLYQIMLEALNYCIENELECEHINELNNIIKTKFKELINELDYLIMDL